MVDINVTVDGDYHSFANPRKNNHIATVLISQVTLEYVTLQCQHNTTTRMIRQKLPLSGNSIFVFKLMVNLTGQHSVPNQGH